MLSVIHKNFNFKLKAILIKFHKNDFILFNEFF